MIASMRRRRRRRCVYVRRWVRGAARVCATIMIHIDRYRSSIGRRASLTSVPRFVQILLDSLRLDDVHTICGHCPLCDTAIKCASAFMPPRAGSSGSHADTRGPNRPPMVYRFHNARLAPTRDHQVYVCMCDRNGRRVAVAFHCRWQMIQLVVVVEVCCLCVCGAGGADAYALTWRSHNGAVFMRLCT